MKISELALLLEGTIEGKETLEITGLSGIEFSKTGDLTFATDDHKLTLAEQSPASCILTTKTTRTSPKPLIRVANPKLAFLITYNIFHKTEVKEHFIHPTAILAPSVKLGVNVWIGPHVCIENNVILGDHSIIESGCTIKENSTLGTHCHLFPNVILYERTQLKNKVILHGGVIIGGDGFGYVKDKGIIYKFPQLGKVIIEDNVEIGANSTVDKGSLGDTIIGANSKIDNLCHIAHNVKLGKNTLMAAQSGIAGSTILGDNVTISGQVAITDNIKVGNNVTVGGKSAVTRDVEDNAVVWGMPARPIAQTKKQMAVLSWATKNFESLSKLIKNQK